MRRAFVLLLCACSFAVATASAAYGIGFIDSPSPHCYRIKGNDCAIGWYYVSVDASPNYIVALRILLGSRLVFNAGGFFQTSLYLPSEVFRDSIRVKCGEDPSYPGPFPTPVPPGTPVLYGNAYSYTIAARDSAGLGSANYGTVYCPPKGR